MKSVFKHIASLLTEFDTVILPDLGAFETQYAGAKIDRVQGYLHPPYKEVVFNAKLKINDGLLLNRLVTKDKLSSDQAQAKIQDVILKTKEKLEKKDVVVIPEVGKLFFNLERKLEFAPYENNLLADAYGLPKVQAFPILRSEEKEAFLNQEKDATPLVEKKKSWLNKMPSSIDFRLTKGAKSVMAVALVGFIASYALYNFFQAPQGNIYQPVTLEERVNVSPDELDSEDVISPEIEIDYNETTDVAMDPVDEELDLNDFSEESVETKAEEETLAEIEVENTSLPKYAIDIGYFKDEQNINKLVKSLFDRGHNPIVVDYRSGRKVGIEFHGDESAAQDTLKEIQKHYTKDAFLRTVK